MRILITRMKRRRLKLTVFVLAIAGGAIINVAVAWGVVLFVAVEYLPAEYDEKCPECGADPEERRV
jgi:hypothetical protein